MQVTSWNIMHGISLQKPMNNGLPSIDSLDLINDCKTISAQVLAVQEIDQFQYRSGNIDQAQIISSGTGLSHYRFAATVIGNPDDGKKGWQSAADQVLDLSNPNREPRYGIGLFSALPVKAWHQWNLVGARITTPVLIPDEKGKPRFIWIHDEPRVVIAAEIQTELGLILFATTHLSFVPGRNVSQFRETLRWLNQFDLPTVLLGDLNLPANAVRFLTSYRRTKVLPTFPVKKPKVQFDHTLSTRNLEIQNETVRQMLVGDHLALSAQIKLSS